VLIITTYETIIGIWLADIDNLVEDLMRGLNGTPDKPTSQMINKST